MALRTGHGTGGGEPRVEVLPANELPPGRAVPGAEPSGTVKRGPKGRIADGEAARAMARLSAAKRARLKAVAAWGAEKGLGRLLPEGFEIEPLLRPFLDEADAWAEAQRLALAADVGGGKINPDASAMIDIAARERLFAKLWTELAMSKHFAWKVVARDAEGAPTKVLPNVELPLAARQMGDSARQNLLAAWETAAKAAAARAKATPADPHAAIAAVVEEYERG